MLSPPKRMPPYLFSISAVILLWILIITKVFTFSFYDNEYDILPYAKQNIHPEWLPRDWYLTLDISYRSLFNLIAGNLVTWFGFSDGAYISRLIGYLAVAIGGYFLFRAINLRFSLAILCLFFFLKSQSLIAGEWIVAGAETKTFAYAFVFLSLACFLQKKYLPGFIFSGLAVSFHVLVGCFAFSCTAIAILLNNHWRSDWRKIVLNSWPFWVTGIVGLQAVFSQLFSSASTSVEKIQAWMIYVTYRVPHHVYPEIWEGSFWIVRLGLGILVFVLIFSTRKSPSAGFISAYGLGSALLFLTGLLFYASGEIALLRYYWFRFPDTIIPFLSALLLAYVANEIIGGRFALPRLASGQQEQIRLWLERTIQIGAVAMLIISVFLSASRLNNEFDQLKSENNDPLHTTLTWISANTPKQAVFLIDPSVHEFYIAAERSVFVTWKTSPQKAKDILEWYQRIQLCNGGRSPEQRSYASTAELRSNFYNLSENQIRQIASMYEIDYYLGLTQENLSFERVYSNSSFTLYKVGDHQ